METFLLSFISVCGVMLLICAGVWTYYEFQIQGMRKKHRKTQAEILKEMDVTFAKLERNKW